MATPVSHPERVSISRLAIDQVKSSSFPLGTTVTFTDADGNEISIPAEVQQAVLTSLRALSERKEVLFGPAPDILTSTEAAEFLNVSRPTLMKWVKEKKIEAFKVGTHTRFSREEVARRRAERQAEQWKAFGEWRELSDELPEH